MVHKMRGAALLSALFIMALVVIAATAMSRALQIDIYRTRLVLGSEQVYWASQAVTFWGLGVLSEKDIQFVSRGNYGKILDFPEQYKNISPMVISKGELFDLQAGFNLNNLKDKKFIPVFNRLLEQTSPGISPEQRKKIANYIVKQKKLTTLSELRLAPGLSARQYQTMRHYLTVLPGVTPININTASVPVLRALGDGLDEEQVKQLLTARGDKGFSSKKDLIQILQRFNIPEGQVTLVSEYYLSRALIFSDDLQLQNNVMIERKKDTRNKVKCRILSESLNG